MKSLKIEKEIIKKFDEAGGEVVDDFVGASNFEWKEILDFFGHSGRTGNKLLDVGAGKGKFSKKLKEKGFDIIAVEPSVKLLEAGKKLYPDINFIQASVTSLPFPDDVFDYVLCVEVLEHIPDTEKAIKEMARVLKSGGKMLIIDKNIISLHPTYLIPTFLWKWFLEHCNKWMYPKNFPFREKYFVPWKVNKIMKRYFKKSKTRFIRWKLIKRKRSLTGKVLAGLYSVVSVIIFKSLPFLNFYVSWRAIK